jgi:hypothetical protein
MARINAGKLHMEGVFQVEESKLFTFLQQHNEINPRQLVQYRPLRDGIYEVTLWKKAA